MYQRILSRLLPVLAWTAMLFEVSHSEVFTSSWKIEHMVLREEFILNKLHAAVAKTKNYTALFAYLKFRQRRTPVVEERQRFEGLQEYLNHPNSLYHSVVEFATEYQELRSALGNVTSRRVKKYLSMIADDKNVIGARRALIRLQNVYNLDVRSMIQGDYLGYLGPELGEMDAFEIGETAFVDGHLSHSLAWLQEALASTFGVSQEGSDEPEIPSPSKSEILALMGRVYVRQGRRKEAIEMYKQAKRMDPTEAHVLELKGELKMKPQSQSHKHEAVVEDFKTLCSVPHQVTSQGQRDPRLNCIYRQVTLPYYRFEQEVLSVSPYVAVFYNLVTESESDTLVNLVANRLERTNVQGHEQLGANDKRINEISELPDCESPVADYISKRIGSVTNLETWKHTSEIQKHISSEPIQVFEGDLPELDGYLQGSGNRLSTFLIHLSDVELGGATIFPNVNVAVKPVKNMGLLWYNYKPSGELDRGALYAGCPVVIGHKWVAVTLIWSDANTFARRCGMTIDATQLDIDLFMRQGWT